MQTGTGSDVEQLRSIRVPVAAAATPYDVCFIPAHTHNRDPTGLLPPFAESAASQVLVAGGAEQLAIESRCAGSTWTPKGKELCLINPETHVNALRA